jgi:hypothetical protein
MSEKRELADLMLLDYRRAVAHTEQMKLWHTPNSPPVQEAGEHEVAIRRKLLDLVSGEGA